MNPNEPKHEQYKLYKHQISVSSWCLLNRKTNTQTMYNINTLLHICLHLLQDPHDVAFCYTDDCYVQTPAVLRLHSLWCTKNDCLQREQTLGSIRLLLRKEHIMKKELGISGTTRFSKHSIFLSQELNFVRSSHTRTLFYLIKYITLHSKTSFFALSAATLSGWKRHIFSCTG